MAYAKWILVGLAVGVALLMMGALERPASPASPPSAADFVPQTLTLAQSVPLEASELLGAACALYQPGRTPWLKTQIWQKMTEADGGFEAEGLLQRGPGSCARLDLTIRTRTTTTQYLVVSDGHALAQRYLLSDQTDLVKGGAFPGEEESGDPWELDHLREMHLRERGGSGPFALLDDMAQQLAYGKVDTGLWRGAPALRLQGWLLGANKKGPPVQATLYFNPETLWLTRLEHRRLNKHGVALDPYLQLEFRNPVVNQPLSRAECERVFTFPTGKIEQE